MQNQVATENAPVSDVSEEQVEKYFESGGTVEVETKPEPKVEAKPEPKVEEKPEVKEEPKEKFVPHGALHEERMRRKQLQTELESTKQKVQRMEQLWQQMQSQQKPQAPAFEENPAEHLRIQQDNLRRQQEQINQHLHQQHQQAQQQQRVQQLVSTYHASADDFRQKTPDFNEAYSFLVSSRIKEYEALGYNKQEASFYVQQEEISIVEKAMLDEVNPAERVYNLSKVRGFSGKPQPQPEKNKIDSLEKGVNASKSLGNVSGKSNEAMSLEQLADLEGEEFDKAWDKMFSSK